MTIPTGTRLPDVLRDLADQAEMYADPDRAVRAARRRRMSRLTATGCAAAVVAVLFGGSAYLPSLVDRGGGKPQATASPADTVPPRLRALYPAIVDPQPDARDLGSVLNPLSEAASLLYAPCPRGDCWPNLVLADGTQYRVPADRGPVQGELGQPRDLGRPRDVTLSPDGRYLGFGYQRDGWYRIVDLYTGQNSAVIGDVAGQVPVSAWAWSPDSRQLLLAEHRDGAVTRYFRHTPSGPRDGSGELPASVAGPDGTVVGIRNNGHLLVRVDSAASRLPVLRVVDPDTRKAVQTLSPPAAGGLLGEGERVLGLLVAACDCAVWFTVYEPGETGRLAALVGMDLTDGHLTGRIDLPKSAEHAGQQPGVWEARSSLPGGIMLVRSHPGGTDIEILNDVNGQRIALTRLPADTYVVLRGQARW